jgi:hypothetical protein
MPRTKARDKKGPFYINKNGSLEWRGPITFYDRPALDGAIVAYLLKASAMGVPVSVAIRDLCRNGGAAQALMVENTPVGESAPPTVSTDSLGDDL